MGECPRIKIKIKNKQNNFTNLKKRNLILKVLADITPSPPPKRKLE